MRIVELHVSANAFGGILGAMRDWLDQNRCDVGRFETSTATPGMILIHVAFRVDSEAEAFQRMFGHAAAM